MPLTFAEIPNFDLLRYLRFGGLPAVYLSSNPDEDLQAYVRTYLTEEIAAEAIVRNIPRFSRFLQRAALTSSELLNFTALASDLGVSATTVREHYRILEDTLLGVTIEPLRKPRARKEVAISKSYFFDLGITNTLRGVRHVEQATEDFGRLFEHFIGLEILAALKYQRIHVPLQFWRTHQQQEVDFVVRDFLAVEVKATHQSSKRHAEGLRAFAAEHSTRHRCVVTRDPVDRTEGGIEFLNYESFLRRLWDGEFFLDR